MYATISLKRSDKHRIFNRKGDNCFIFCRAHVKISHIIMVDIRFSLT